MDINALDAIIIPCLLCRCVLGTPPFLTHHLQDNFVYARKNMARGRTTFQTRITSANRQESLTKKHIHNDVTPDVPEQRVLWSFSSNNS